MICKIEDFVFFNPTESIKPGTLAKKIPMDALVPFCRKAPYFVLEKYNGGTKFRNGDTIMARITPCLENGKTAMIDVLDNDEVGFGSTEYIVLRAKPDKCDPHFLYYLMRSSFIRNIAIKSMVGSSGRQRVQTDVLKKTVIDLPALSEQKRIGETLSLLDSKIESNEAINKNLFEQAKTLFDLFLCNSKSAELEKGPIYEIADIIYGAPFSSKLFNEEKNGKPIVRIRDLGTNLLKTYTTEVHPKGYLLKYGDIVVGMDGEFKPYIWGNEDAWLNQRLCVFQNKVGFSKFFVFFTIVPQLHYIEQTETATTVIHIGKNDFDKFYYYKFDKDIIERYNSFSEPIYWEIVENMKSNNKIKEMRNLLLEKLINK